MAGVVKFKGRLHATQDVLDSVGNLETLFGPFTVGMFAGGNVVTTNTVEIIVQSVFLTELFPGSI
jgi:hypothetical protein